MRHPPKGHSDRTFAVLLIPAIDLKDGQCVQLRQGVMASAAIYSNQPSSMAKRWIDAGARRLHVVDLDGAFAGTSVNRCSVADIVQAAGDVPVQVGGGIRDAATARGYFDIGVSQVIAGTRAVEEPDFLRELASTYPGRVVLGLDARDGKAATHGWTSGDTVDVVAFAASLNDVPLFGIVYTDIARDGMLVGVNAASMERLAMATRLPIIASGGVRNLDDLRALQATGLGEDRLLGAISGSALYEGTLDFAAGQRLLDQLAEPDAAAKSTEEQR